MIGGDKDGAINFVASMNANGGGPAGGEAMVDGIHAANNLIFREFSKRICVLVGD